MSLSSDLEIKLLFFEKKLPRSKGVCVCVDGGGGGPNFGLMIRDRRKNVAATAINGER